MRVSEAFVVVRGYFAHLGLWKQAKRAKRARNENRSAVAVFALRWLHHTLPSSLTLLMMGMLLALYFSPQVFAARIDVLGVKSELGCLALNSYRERAIAGKEFPTGSSDAELMAFAWVVKNRLDIGFHQNGQAVPETLCDVVWADAQYSWTSWDDGKKFFISDTYRPEFYRALRAAKAVLAETPDALAVKRMIGDADHYVNLKRANPSWAKRMEAKGDVGYHAFFTETGRFGEARALNAAFEVMGMK